MNMESFFVTFQQKYAREEHPLFPEINHKSYVVIKAYSEAEARTQAFEMFGDAWAMLYTEKGFDGQVEQYDLKEVVIDDAGTSTDHSVLHRWSAEG